MKPTETLVHEHKIIRHVLAAANREADRVEAGEVDTAKLERILDFLRNFADRCHHAKEERLLFERMKARGLPAKSGPIAVMMAEHEAGRAHIRAVAEALPKAASGDAAARKLLAGHLRGYVELLDAHIFKEDQVLYPIANQILTAEDQTALEADFEKVEAEELGHGTHEKYHQLAHELGEKS